MHYHKKKYGQNFIADKNLINKIVENAHIDGKNVLEIGPGKGALTNLLISKANKYLGFEIDVSLKPILDNILKPNAKIIYNDFLSRNTSNIINDYFKGESIHLVANLPYNITSPVIFKFLETKNIEEAVIMVQKEVAERMISKKNSSNYSAFTVILDYYANTTKIMDVSRKLFKPIPKVDSAVVKITKNNELLEKEEHDFLIDLIKKSFTHKRKN